MTLLVNFFHSHSAGDSAGTAEKTTNPISAPSLLYFIATLWGHMEQVFSSELPQVTTRSVKINFFMVIYLNGLWCKLLWPRSSHLLYSAFSAKRGVRWKTESCNCLSHNSFFHLQHSMPMQNTKCVFQSTSLCQCSYTKKTEIMTI